MNLSDFSELLKSNGIEFRKNESMKEHTTFKIGGCCDIFIMPKTREEIAKVIKWTKEKNIPLFVLGKGSNLLVSDDGIEGAVISLSNLNKIRVDDNRIICGAGVNMSALCITARDNSLSGLEFAYGIPGSVGGGLFMNAGAYGGEMSDVVVGAYCIGKGGTEIYISAEDMELSYRHSVFKENGYVITEIILSLTKGDRSQISSKMTELLNKRKSKQPLEYPSAGSTFKRPEGNFAGTLIEQNGLKGEKVGGAMVSEKHAGFVINYNNASAKDVLGLIDIIKNRVYKNEGIVLEPEVIFVGRR